MTPLRSVSLNASRSARAGWWTGLIAALLAMALVSAGCDSNGGMDDPPPPTEEPTILDLASDNDDLSTLATALGATGLDATLDDRDATFTVFAPADAAFAPYDVDVLVNNPDLLSDVLGFHVVQGAAVFAGDLSDGDTFTTVQGDEVEIAIEGGTVFVEGARVTTADVEAANGVVHVIDDVLLTNRTAGERLLVTTATASLYGAIEDAGLTDAFNNPDNAWTTFAPSGDAFAAADLSGFTGEEIQAVLQYHTLDGITDSAALLQLLADNGGTVAVPTNQGEDLTITQQDETTITFNGDQATLDLDRVDQRASNGIIHLIDGVLLPPSLGEMPEPTIADIVAENDDFSTLLAAVDAAGLTSALADESASLTVFAPNDDGFAPINTDNLLADNAALADVLQYHVVDQEIFASDLSDGDNAVTTLSGDELTVTVDGDDIFVEGSQVIQTDIEAGNGVIHVLNRTLLGNQNLANVVQFTAETEALFGAVADAGLADAFVNADDWTLFGPNNDTFASADLSGFTDEEIQEILQYHVFPDAITSSSDLLQLLADNGGTVTLTTLQGEDLTITQQDASTIVFNDDPNDGPQAMLDLSNLDYVGSNGILHVIDGLLVPPSLTAPTISGIVAGGDSFTTLATALGATGLDATLDDRDATFTVFAPADAAFAPYDVDVLVNNPDLLSDVLGFHVVQGAAVFAGDLSDGDTFTTVQGDEVEIAIEGGTVFVEGARVTTADVEAANGVVHVIDDVLLTNRTAGERATVTSAFSILADLVGEAGLAEALSGPGPDGEDGLTVFAPTNEAFLAALDANDNGVIDGSEIPSNAADILQYHVLDDVFFATDVPTMETALPTLEGSDVTVVRSGSEVTINPNADNASVIAPDVEASNGVIHGIDTVLSLPSQ